MLQPVLVLVAWSIVMLVWLYVRRLPMLFNYALSRPTLVDGEATRMLSAPVQWPADNYNNLMEQPTLFYALALGVYLSGQSNFDVRIPGLAICCAAHYPFARPSDREYCRHPLLPVRDFVGCAGGHVLVGPQTGVFIAPGAKRRPRLRTFTFDGCLIRGDNSSALICVHLRFLSI